ncbi:MAG TPA: hypothetical protein VF524_10130, partial [Polyangia bacterium]
MTFLTSLLAAADAGAVGPGAPEASAASGDDTAAGASTSAASPAEPRLAATAFATERQPRARRTKAWTRPRHSFSPRWEADYPEVHFSRFLNLARPDFHPPKIHDLTEREWRGALFHFASAVIADLREAIDIACPKERCAPALAEASQRLASFVRAGGPAFTHVDRGGSSDQWNTGYGWRLTDGTASFDLGCNDLTEAPEVTCRLELDLDAGLMLTYAP